MIAEFLSIPGSYDWTVIEPVTKGWSSDRKYYVETCTGEKLMVRIASAGDYEQKKTEFELLCQLEQMAFHLPKPLDIGICLGEQSIYTVYTWLDGEEATDKLTRFSPEQQYRLGNRAGHILKCIHSLPVSESQQKDWGRYFRHKIMRKVEKYHQCPVKFQEAETIIDFINQHLDLLDTRPVTFQHGDFHVGNMIIDQKGNLGIIDFNRHDIGDPWEEFNRITWSAHISPAFATGQIDGYFDGKIPEHFFTLQALYIGANMISSIPWAMEFGDGEVETMKQQIQLVCDAFKGFSEIKPIWYQK